MNRPDEGGTTRPLRDLVRAGVFPDDQFKTRVFIITPATYSQDLTDETPPDEVTASLTNGNFQPLFDGQTPPAPDRLSPIKAALRGLIPNVPVDQFIYRRKTEGVAAQVPMGKAAVSSDLGFPAFLFRRRSIISIQHANGSVTDPVQQQSGPRPR